MPTNTLPAETQPLRFAIYARYSTDMQNEISLEDQEKYCRKAIAERDGSVVEVYTDAAKSGWSLDREGFNKLRTDAEHGRFDTIMFWKFDRLARNHDHSVMIKILLRGEYGLKLYCVEGYSEDDEESPYAAMMEQLLSIFYAFYSKNLSTDAKRAKLSRAEEGKFNGSVAPLGYKQVTRNQATAEQPDGLYIMPRTGAVVRRAFKRYATAEFSDGEIASWLNKQRAIQIARVGQKPLDKDMVRDMLQNRTYTGRVSYSETQYSGSLGEGKKSSRHRRTWYEGRHQAIISDELFDRCQEVRAKIGGKHASPSRLRTYIMADRVYCARCVINRPSDYVDEHYGKMRPSADERYSVAKARYRCSCTDRGYVYCGQKQVQVTIIDQQIADILSKIRIPDSSREKVEGAVRNRVENEATLKRMDEIKQIIERVDLRWDEGFISKDEYIEKRRQLQQEFDALHRLDNDDLQQAADLLGQFRTYWDECANSADPLEARRQLVSKIVERVIVYDENVVAVVLHGQFAVVIGRNQSAPVDITDAVFEVLTRDGLFTL